MLWELTISDVDIKRKKSRALDWKDDQVVAYTTHVPSDSAKASILKRKDPTNIGA